MTREEKQKAIAALKISAPVKAVTAEEFADYIRTLNKIMDWLEQPETATEFVDRCQECGKQKLECLKDYKRLLDNEIAKKNEEITSLKVELRNKEIK